MKPEVERLAVQYPGGFAARYRWSGSGRADEIFGVSEAAGTLHDHGTLVDPHPDRLCRAELRVEGPTGAWTARFASVVFDEPQGVFWDSDRAAAGQVRLRSVCPGRSIRRAALASPEWHAGR